MAELKLKNVRLAFPDLGEPVQFQGKGSFYRQATFLIDPGSENDKLIKAEMERVAKATWPKTWERELQMSLANPQRACYVSGDIKAYDGFVGKMALSAKRYVDAGRPVIVNRENRPVMPGDEGFPYAGSYVHAVVEIWPQDNEYGKAIRCTLVGVMFYRDGDSFGGTKPADANVFSDLVADEEEEALV